MTRLVSFFLKFIYRKSVVLSASSIIYPSSKFVNISKIRENIIVGDNTHIRGELLVYGHSGKIDIGNYCYIGEGSRIWSAKNINIGNRVLIAHNVNIHDNISHPLDYELRHIHFKQIILSGHPQDAIDLGEREIHIADDAWIGFNSTILRGVSIGKGAVIGACSVVTKDVAAFTTVVGNPAREVSSN